jgi:hypothetical protein
MVTAPVCWPAETGAVLEQWLLAAARSVRPE